MGRSRTLQSLAKMLTYVLARRPDEFGLVPDADGYVKIKDLLKALHEDEGLRYVNRSHLAEIILSVPEAPIEISGKPHPRPKPGDACAGGRGRSAAQGPFHRHSPPGLRGRAGTRCPGGRRCAHRDDPAAGRLPSGWESASTRSRSS
ncbi:MAG: RNA 2'-phosphotransferase [Desulfobacterales bacterium]|nr:RNA 2'-phosphotransferase [Desulfobacterales bacterium]